MKNRFTVAVTGQSLIKLDVRPIRDQAFLDVKALIAGADLAFTNFESTIYGRHGGFPLKGSYFGCSSPFTLDALQEIGFGALSLSNNHAFDLGPPGILSTLEEADRRGFLHAGLGRNHEEAERPGIAEVGGRSVALVAMDGGPGPDFMAAADAAPGRPERPGVNRLRLSQVIGLDGPAFEALRSIRDRVGYNAMDLANDSQPDDPPRLDEDTEIGFARTRFRRAARLGRQVDVDTFDMARNLSAIASAADTGSLVIAYLHHHHWAADWHQVPDFVGDIARRCIDAGASMFVSHGAPVLQPLEIYRSRPIFYSLGNFLFHVASKLGSAKSAWTAPQVWESVVALCTFDEGGDLLGMTVHPVIIGGEAGLDDPGLEHRLVPHLASGAGAARILRRFTELSAGLGTQIDISDGIGRLSLVSDAVAANVAG